jgi:PAS domain-containing protein
VEQEQVLRNSEARLNEAQHRAHIGNWELELASNKLHWSDEIFRIFEIDEAKFGASYEAFLNAIHPDDRDMVNKAYSEALATRQPYDIVHRPVSDGRNVVHERCETPDAKKGDLPAGNSRHHHKILEKDSGTAQ